VKRAVTEDSGKSRQALRSRGSSLFELQTSDFPTMDLSSVTFGGVFHFYRDRKSSVVAMMHDREKARLDSIHDSPHTVALHSHKQSKCCRTHQVLVITMKSKGNNNKARSCLASSGCQVKWNLTVGHNAHFITGYFLCSCEKSS
jgi:hypothetical protein